MTIENRNLTPGTKLIAKYHKESHSCEVIEGENNKLRYRLADGREFKSPSAAGMAITSHACDGWVFWKVETEIAALASQPVQQVVQEVNAEVEKAAETKNAVVEQAFVKKPFHRTPNQKGVSEDQTRWYCQVCGKSFLAPYGEIPLGCPQGHKA